MRYPVGMAQAVADRPSPGAQSKPGSIDNPLDYEDWRGQEVYKAKATQALVDGWPSWTKERGIKAGDWFCFGAGSLVDRRPDLRGAKYPLDWNPTVHALPKARAALRAKRAKARLPHTEVKPHTEVYTVSVGSGCVALREGAALDVILSHLREGACTRAAGTSQTAVKVRLTIEVLA